MPEIVPVQYHAFISYSHRDVATSKWLHRKLESYRIDKDLVGRTSEAGSIPKTLRPIFRDREEFVAGHSLTEQTLAALETSKHLVVLCSPNSASSQYVNEEIRRFKALGRANRVVPLIIGGKPGSEQECFPPALRFGVNQNGELTDEVAEPLAADLSGDGKHLALQKVVAGLLGVRLEEIVKRAAAADRRRRRLWAGVSVAMALLAGGAGIAAMIAVDQKQRATLQRARAETEESKTLLRRAKELEARGDQAGAMRYVLAAMPRHFAAPERALVPSAMDAFLRINHDLKQHRVLGGDPWYQSAAYDRLSGSYFATSNAGQIDRWSSSLTRIVATRRGSGPFEAFAVYPGGERVLAATREEVLLLDEQLGLVTRLARPGPVTARSAAEYPPTEPFAAAAQGALFAMQDEKGRVVVRGTSHGQTASTIERAVPIDRFQLSPSGRMIALVTERQRIEIIELSSSKTVAEATLTHAVSQMAFSPDETRLVVQTAAHALELVGTDQSNVRERIDFSPLMKAVADDNLHRAGEGEISEFIQTIVGGGPIRLSRQFAVLALHLSYTVRRKPTAPDEGSSTTLGRTYLVLLFDLQAKTFYHFRNSDLTWQQFDFIDDATAGLLLGGDGAVGLLEFGKGRPEIVDTYRVNKGALIYSAARINDGRIAYLSGDGMTRIQPHPMKLKSQVASTPCAPERVFDCAIGMLPALRLPQLRIDHIDSAPTFSRNDRAWANRGSATPILLLRAGESDTVLAWSERSVMRRDAGTGATRTVFEATGDSKIDRVLATKSLAVVITTSVVDHRTIHDAHIVALAQGFQAAPRTMQLPDGYIRGIVLDPTQGHVPNLLVMQQLDDGHFLTSIALDGMAPPRRQRCEACAAETYLVRRDRLIAGTIDGMIKVRARDDDRALLSVFGVQGNIVRLTADAEDRFLAAVSNDGELVVIDSSTGAAKLRAFNVDSKVEPAFGPSAQIAYVDQRGRLRRARLVEDTDTHDYLTRPDTGAVAIAFDETGESIKMLTAAGALITVPGAREEFEEAVWWQRATSSFDLTWHEKQEFLNSGRWRDASGLAKAYGDVGKRCDIVGADAFDPRKTEIGKIGRAESENKEAVAACLAAIQRYPGEPRYRHQAGVAYLSIGDAARAYAILKPNIEAGYPASYWCLAEAILKLGRPTRPGHRNPHPHLIRVGTQRRIGPTDTENLPDPRQLLVKASSAGVPAALHRLAEIDSAGVDENSPAQTRLNALFRLAGEAGYPKSHLVLGNDYKEGKFMPRDLRKSFYHYALAAELMDWFEWVDEAELDYANRQRALLAHALGREAALAVWRDVEIDLVRIKERVESIQSNRLWARLTGYVRTKLIEIEQPTTTPAQPQTAGER